MTLNILKGFEFGERDCARTWHRQLEAMKLAYVDGLHYISQPQSMRGSVEELLHEDYAAIRRALIGERALDPSPGQPRPGGTVYLACGDEEGNLVSFIQSNYHGFGSGVVVPGTGIALQNRGAEFSLDPDHVNCLEPGKQTFHHHSRFPQQGRRAARPVRRDGRLHAAAGPRADGDEPGGLRPQPPGRPRRAALAVAGRAARRHRTCRAARAGGGAWRSVGTRWRSPTTRPATGAARSSCATRPAACSVAAPSRAPIRRSRCGEGTHVGEAGRPVRRITPKAYPPCGWRSKKSRQA